MNNEDALIVAVRTNLKMSIARACVKEGTVRVGLSPRDGPVKVHRGITETRTAAVRLKMQTKCVADVKHECALRVLRPAENLTSHPV
jgi:hypothetical protein